MTDGRKDRRMEKENRQGKEKPESELLQQVMARSLANPFPKYCHIQITVLEKDHVEVCVDLEGRDELKNYAGFVHGGLFFTMADFCAATTARTDDRKYVTLQADTHYTGNVTEGRITAKSRVVHRGRSSVLVHVDIVDCEEKQLCCSDVTMFCVGSYV